MGRSGLFVWHGGEAAQAPPQGWRAPGRAQHRELSRRLARLQRDYADLHAALFEAAQVHRRLCAPRLVRCGEFEIASEIFAGRYLPGDFFTIEETGNGLLLALGDVCGKGLAAGMWTPCLVGLVRAHAAVSDEPEAIVTGVNREFHRMHAPLTSLFLARLDPAAGTLDYCCAGHPPALLLRESGAAEALSEGGMLLGMSADAAYRSGRVTLGAGDVLLAYSDGVVESRNGSDEEFGFEGLEAHLRHARTGSAEAVLFSILAAVQDFAAPHALADDTSLVVIRRCGSDRACAPARCRGGR
jgi:sigma-B regulation protein RsbU (phosphoserine phosphatase)